MRVLGIESSCDETAAAVVTDAGDILSHVIHHQLADHAPYGGIVPEVAARAHLDQADAVIAAAMRDSGIGWDGLDGIAATAGPGLIGGVLVGVMTAKAIAAARDLPFLAINHLEAHALTPRLTDPVDFPYLLLLVSGGHCQLLVVKDVGQYQRLGTTIDDAVGEAFDKTAKMLGLGYPGGPAVEKAAKNGDSTRFDLPRPLKGRSGCDFSFSGLKTRVRMAIESLPAGTLLDQDISDLCASFQYAVADVLAERSSHAIQRFQEEYAVNGTFVVAGGVAANSLIRSRLQSLAERHGMAFSVPPSNLCTDNGAMVAWAGIERLRRGLSDGLDFKPRPRWPLDPDAPPARGAGVKA